MFWGGLAGSLETLSFTSVDDKLLQDLLHLLEQPTVRPSQLIRPIIGALRCHTEFSQLLKLVGSEKPEIEIAYGDVAEQLSEIPLFLRILQLSPIDGLEIEQMLTFIRHAMLQETMARMTDGKGLPFSSALALQCFTNEYIFQETKEETAAVEQLQQQIATLVEEGQNIPPSLVATVAAYRPLYEFAWAQELCEHEWIDNIKEVITRQISEPQEEQSLRSQIPQLTSIKNAVSQSVREQYEENPYPRWIKTGLADKGRAIGDVLQRAPLRLDLGDYESPENPEILVAGCGTGQHALVTASRFSNARVLAVDLSLSSLSYAMRKTNELSFANIEYAQADIMELGDLGRQFDLIECVGVLHHLGDPLAGWRVLVDLLQPGGLMMIGLYSETARQHIIDGRSLIAEKGYTTSPEDIRRCREDIISKAEHGNRTMVDICNSPDFFSLSNCRDMLFHVQEHRFTLPQIEENLQALKLRFLGFEMGGQRTFKKFEKSHPGKQALTSLPLW
ncbi:MAG: class I SAM-dependent methyltransferase, partial [Dehalococcoidia bacterium]|nr:class I SAM-dependent methyltransferase [Dehalococcoidia bacterium]